MSWRDCTALSYPPSMRASARFRFGHPTGGKDRRDAPAPARRRSVLPDLAIPREVAHVPLPTAAGQFEVRAFQGRSGLVYLAMVRGRVEGGHSILARLHSECVT